MTNSVFLWEDLILSKLDWAKESRSQPPETDALCRAMLMQRSGEKRFVMGYAMGETARTLVEASIRNQDPQATPEAARKSLSPRRLYHITPETEVVTTVDG